MSDKEDTDDKTAQDAPLTDEEAQAVQGGALLPPESTGVFVVERRSV
ncbi:MAG: hypothetical protein U0904_03915 [Candidatus Nanopelagicales bacterium]|nr:hypothetical protein [Candidatus Nanopelagicales bacterium]